MNDVPSRRGGLAIGAEAMIFLLAVRAALLMSC